MNLKNILKGIDKIKYKGNLDIEINGIESNSQKIQKGFLFVSIKGFKNDGHCFIKQAIENGASAIVIQKDYNKEDLENVLTEEITVIISENTREFLALVSSNYYR